MDGRIEFELEGQINNVALRYEKKMRRTPLKRNETLKYLKDGICASYPKMQKDLSPKISQLIDNKYITCNESIADDFILGNITNFRPDIAAPFYFNLYYQGLTNQPRVLPKLMYCYIATKDYFSINTILDYIEAVMNDPKIKDNHTSILKFDLLDSNKDEKTTETNNPIDNDDDNDNDNADAKLTAKEKEEEKERKIQFESFSSKVKEDEQYYFDDDIIKTIWKLVLKFARTVYNSVPLLIKSEAQKMDEMIVLLERLLEQKYVSNTDTNIVSYFLYLTAGYSNLGLYRITVTDLFYKFKVKNIKMKLFVPVLSYHDWMRATFFAPGIFRSRYGAYNGLLNYLRYFMKSIMVNPEAYEQGEILLKGKVHEPIYVQLRAYWKLVKNSKCKTNYASKCKPWPKKIHNFFQVVPFDLSLNIEEFEDILTRRFWSIDWDRKDNVMKKISPIFEVNKENYTQCYQDTIDYGLELLKKKDLDLYLDFVEKILPTYNDQVRKKLLATQTAIDDYYTRTGPALMIFDGNVD